MRQQLVTAAFAVLFVACSKPPVSVAPVPLAPLAIDARVYKDDAGGIRNKVERAIRDSTEWREVWGQVTSRQSRPAAAQVIDFRLNMLVLVATGPMYATDSINIDSVATKSERTEADRTQEVVWVYYSVIRDCPPSTREAFPLEIVRVRRSMARVQFDQKIKQGPNCR